MTQTKNAKEIIVDVRTQEEWNYDGHADCSVLIPLDQLQNRIAELQGYDKITLVCRSGARAGAAKSLLEANGLKNIVNLGPWQNIQCAVN